jgi:uncharacterized DUF497 family protein
MPIRYDPAKAAANLERHWVSLADAGGALADPLAITVRDPDTEHKFVTLGLGSAVELLVVAWTPREQACRLISARRATRKERKRYEA